MGVLDDAIREHLELKRQHGASEAEVSGKEQEALGARRATPPAPAPEEVAQQPTVEDPPPQPPIEEPAVEDPMPAIDDVVATAPEPAPGEQHAPPTTEPEVETEDVLEETPEFLQETPEHDRLWFEQKPPRDFDFDE